MTRVYLKLNNKPLLPIRLAILLLGITFISVTSYLLASQFIFRSGFPLDDAWIHQTYARNLAFHGEWAFFPGMKSGGSTSPLWTFLLSIGYLIKIPPILWASFLGALCLWVCSILAEMIVRHEIDSYRPNFPWVGCILILEWHLTWAAVSGMETILFSSVALSVIFLMYFEKTNYLLVGLMIGISVWIRPEGLILLGPVLLAILISLKKNKTKLINISLLLIGFILIFIFYLAFNYFISGNPWPNTLYAKQAEYASIYGKKFFSSFASQLLQIIVGVGVILFPGVVATSYIGIKQRHIAKISAVIWIVTMIGLFSWKLPVTYQHGRYIIPVIPVFLILGSIGLIKNITSQKSMILRILRSSWNISTAVVILSFWILGLYSYGADVAFIEKQMVDTAKWVSENIPSSSVIAAHDIGALGFFDNHKLIDLAGLVTPEIIPIIRDEDKLIHYLNEKNVDYLIIFPGWYSKLGINLIKVYSSGGESYGKPYSDLKLTVLRWKGIIP